MVGLGEPEGHAPKTPCAVMEMEDAGLEIQEQVELLNPTITE